MHRAENVDVESRLRNLTRALDLLHKTYKVPIVVSTHPRTRSRMAALGIGTHPSGARYPGGPGSTPAGSIPDIRFLEPFGFFDFIALERNALCVVSDSGTVQEECCIFGVPNVTIRDVTERPETIECGSNILAGSEPETIARCVQTVLGASPGWTPPAEYLATNVSDRVVRIVTGYRR
jgi:UDP-N-acetylglucosamine 2-epimerase (non-hydrolysing)